MQRRLIGVGSWALVIGLCTLAQPAHGVITRLTPLREVLHSQQLIFTVKVDKLDPDKPSVVFKVDEELKGKAAFKRMPVNLTADSYGQKEMHTAQLLKRLAADLPLIVFANKRDKRYEAFAYTNGTWFQILGQVGEDADKVRWSFTHCEPYLRRTFKGTTDELKQVLRDGLEGKKDPPGPDAKEPPGLGPEVKPDAKKKASTRITNGPLFAVIPTFVIIGPIALLAALFPAVFGGLALLMRRWMVLLTIASLDSTLYFAHAWFRGYLKDTWWGTPLALWSTLTVVTLMGALWSWRRQRAWARANLDTAARSPRRTEQLILWLGSLTGAVVVITCVLKGVLFHPPWKEMLVLWSVAWVGLTYNLVIQRLAKRQPAGGRAPATEGVMLWALVIACASLGATVLPRKSDSTVQKIWTFEPSDRGAFLSSPVVEGHRVYIAAVHGAGFSSFGAVYCLDRDTRAVIWKFDDEGGMQQVYSTPCLADGRLFIGEGLHENRGCKFYCLDAGTGRKIWHFETASHTESSPCAVGGKVYFGAGDGGLYCFDAASGKECWHFDAPLHVDADPVVVGNRLYCGSGTSRTRTATEIFCLDAQSGKVNWRQSASLPVWGSPTAVGKHVFFGLGNGRMDNDAPPPEKPAGALMCVLAESGEQVWKCDLPNAVLVKPAVDEQHIYFGSRDGHCYCIARPNGSIVWKKDMGSPVVAAPALLDKHLYVAGRDGNVCCLKAADGSEIWTFDVAGDSQTRPHLLSTPAVIREGHKGTRHHRIYFGAGLETSLSTAAVLYCLQAPL